MHNATVVLAKRIGHICEEFLKTYAEEATARVSREAFERSIGDICKMMLQMHSECDERHVAMGLPHHQHAEMQPIFVDLTKDHFTCILLNFRTQELLGQRISRAEALQQMKGIPAGIEDDEGKKMFIMHFLLQRPQKMTLAEVEMVGVKPHKLISHLKQASDKTLFDHEVESKATQQPGLA